MTRKEWLTEAKVNKDVILELINRWHPSGKGYNGINTVGPITAPNAEVASSHVRTLYMKGDDPAERFIKALEGEDISTMISILNGAWFGVPESTCAWRIKGFSEVVRLLEDMPEEDEDANTE